MPPDCGLVDSLDLPALLDRRGMHTAPEVCLCRWVLLRFLLKFNDDIIAGSFILMESVLAFSVLSSDDLTHVCLWLWLSSQGRLSERKREIER